MRNSIRLAVLGALVLGFAGAASAATANSTLDVTTIIDPQCVLQPAQLNFIVDPASLNNGVNQDAQTQISMQCTNGTDYSVALDQGQFSDGTLAGGAADRAMFDTVSFNQAHYQLYSDAARTVVWNAANQVTGTGAGNSFTMPVYGSVTGGQNLAPGAYDDTVQVTATF